MRRRYPCVSLMAIVIAFTVMAVLDCARAQDISTQIVDLCGSSNMQSFSSSGVNNNIATQFTAIYCAPEINGFYVDLFNGVESITCPNLSDQQIQATTFSASMTCSGPENGGRGITGSFQVPINGSSSTLSSLVQINNGLTAKNLAIVANDADITISGRACTITLRAQLFAKNSVGDCVPCLDTIIISNEKTCGVLDQEESCGFWKLGCAFENGTWDNSALFWMLFIVIFLILVPVVALVLVLNKYDRRIRKLVIRGTREAEATSAGNMEVGDSDRNMATHAKKFGYEPYDPKSDAHSGYADDEIPMKRGGGRHASSSSSRYAASSGRKRDTDPLIH